MEKLVSKEREYRPATAENNRPFTKKRQLIVRALAEYGDYTDAVSLYLNLRKKHDISIASVYITLKLMAEMGFAATRMDSEGKKIEYKAVV